MYCAETDLLSSTPRQIVLYRALVAIGRAQVVPEFGHLPYVMGEGNRKLSKRDPESNLLIHRYRGMIPEGLLNYLALLGWSLSADRDVFSAAQMVAAFDVADVNPNPARFDPRKCEAINAEQVRALEEKDFRDRLVPYLADAYPDPAGQAPAEPLVSAASFDELTAREQEILDAAAPLIQTRIQMLRECRDMLGFLFVPDSELAIDAGPVAGSRTPLRTSWTPASGLSKGSPRSSGRRPGWRRLCGPPSSKAGECPAGRASSPVWLSAHCAWL